MSKSFCSVGVTILDILGHPISRIPDGESTEVIEKIHICAAGTAAAPAVIAARMGMESTLVSAVADDDIGYFIRRNLEREGVDTSFISLRDDLPSAATILPINRQGERPNWHMPGAFLMMEIDEQAKERVIQSDHVHWGGIGLLFNLDGAVAANILASAKAKGAITTADLIAPGPQTPDAVKALAPHLDYFMPSIGEALEISGASDAASAAEFFMEWGAGGCVIKCGADGAFLATRSGTRKQIPAIKDVEVVDTSGCGDAFCAGFQVALSRDIEAEEAVKFAAATAAQVAAGLGSDACVKDFDTTHKIMMAGSIKALTSI